MFSFSNRTASLEREFPMRTSHQAKLVEKSEQEMRAGEEKGWETKDRETWRWVEEVRRKCLALRQSGKEMVEKFDKTDEVTDFENFQLEEDKVNC